MKYLVVDTLEVLEPWPAWAADNPEHSAHHAVVVTWVVIIWWIIWTNTRGIRLLEIVVRMMDRLIDNPRTLNIASRGLCRYILPLLLLVHTILFP